MVRPSSSTRGYLSADTCAQAALSSSTCFSLWIINKAGGLIYSKNYAGTAARVLTERAAAETVRFAEGLAHLTSNENLVLASTFHSVHAIAARISPVPGSSGIETVEADGFKMNCMQSPTGVYALSWPSCCLADVSAQASSLCSSRHRLTHRHSRSSDASMRFTLSRSRTRSMAQSSLSGARLLTRGCQPRSAVCNRDTLH